eukprot:533881-Alexandrium_andersonii.AAC.1
MEVLAHAPPSTRRALARAWLNGWCTQRRFQCAGVCPFCGEAEDSLEHFTQCHVLRGAGNA